jgi:hypothetical protein
MKTWPMTQVNGKYLVDNWLPAGLACLPASFRALVILFFSPSSSSHNKGEANEKTKRKRDRKRERERERE